MWISTPELTPESIRKIILLPNVKNLNKLSINDNRKLTDEVYLEVIKTFTNMMHLDVCFCSNLTSCSIKQTSILCPKLEHLNISTTKISTGFDSSWESLTFLNINSCSYITDGGLAEITSQCKNLIHINVSECDNLSSEGLSKISENCKFLEHLDVNETEFNKSINGICEHLRILCARRCKRLTNDGIRQISKNCVHLQNIDLSYCDSITDIGLKIISLNCTKLQRLNLKWCKSITQDGIINLEEVCKTLQHLDISGMYRQPYWPLPGAH